MRFVLFIVMFLLSFVVFGQEIQNRLQGNWMMSEVVLETSAYNTPEKKNLTTYKQLPQSLDHFLFNQCITKIESSKENTSVEIYYNIIKNIQIIEENNYIFWQDEFGNRFGPYSLNFTSEKELVISTPEVFYNDDQNKSMRAVLQIYMHNITKTDNLREVYLHVID